jgi:hypothetical protein
MALAVIVVVAASIAYLYPGLTPWPGDEVKL